MKKGQEDNSTLQISGEKKKCMNTHTDWKVGQSPNCDSQNRVSNT